MQRLGMMLAIAMFGCTDAVIRVVDYPPLETDNRETEPLDSSDTTGDSASESDTSALPFLLGADLSWVQEQEDLGVMFTDNGVKKDILEILKDHGFNAVRLRLFHSPGTPDGYQFAFGERAEPYCDLSHTLEMATRVKAAAMFFMLDFHYSDTWADPGNQHKPAAWEGLSFDTLRDAVYTYTRDVLSAFKDASCLPDLVQLGNEITAGMLFPDGQTYDPDNWDQLAKLLLAASSGVREVEPKIRIVLHLDKGDDNETTVWWVDEALKRGVTFDVLAESTYTRWQGEPDGWRANFTALATEYPTLSFLIAEYGDRHREANDIIHDTPRGLGSFVWEPTADGDWGQGLFDMPDGAGEATPRATLTLFDEMARDFGLEP